MKKEPISIIIPTLNEADYLGYLLFSLSRQTHQNFEVIVSDGNSRDGTIAVAKNFKKLLPSFKITTSRKRSPAHQRNQGAKLARHERLLFLDADAILPPDFLAKALLEIQKKKLDAAGGFAFPISQKLLNSFLFSLQNVAADVLERFYPVAGGWTIFATRKLHQKLGGFDEELHKIGEDADYIIRAAHAGAKFRMLRTTAPYVSTRRIEYEGLAKPIRDAVVLGLTYFALTPKNAQKLLKRKYGDYARLKKTS